MIALMMRVFGVYSKKTTMDIDEKLPLGLGEKKKASEETFGKSGLPPTGRFQRSIFG